VQLNPVLAAAALAFRPGKVHPDLLSIGENVCCTTKGQDEAEAD
jgi:hypothetical protein